MRIRAAIGPGSPPRSRSASACRRHVARRTGPRAKDRGRVEGELSSARAHARRWSSGGRPEHRPSGAPRPRATLALRDLAGLRGELRGAAGAGRRLLARPVATATVLHARRCACTGRPPRRPVDGTATTPPDSWCDCDGRRECRELRRRRLPRPAPDGSRGGNNKTDVYIGDIGAHGTLRLLHHRRAAPASGRLRRLGLLRARQRLRREFPTNTPIENMRVTAAHEYFHAVQYAYDAFEDGWLLEATATWVEDEMFDDVNDNLQYLRHGPLGAADPARHSTATTSTTATGSGGATSPSGSPAKTGRLAEAGAGRVEAGRRAGRRTRPYSTQALSAGPDRAWHHDQEGSSQQFSGANRHPAHVRPRRATPTRRRSRRAHAQLQRRAAEGSRTPRPDAFPKTVKLNPNGLRQLATGSSGSTFDAPGTSAGRALVVIVRESGGGAHDVARPAEPATAAAPEACRSRSGEHRPRGRDRW